MRAKGDKQSGLAEQMALAERLLEQRQLSEALAAFGVAEAMGADADQCSAARWKIAMLQGNFEVAWCQSDAIRRRGGFDPHRFWDGEEIQGRRVMVRCLHGFGDAIQLLRFLPRMQALAENVTVEVPPHMLPIASLLDGVDEVITWGEMAPPTPPVWEVQVEVMELPYLFRTTQKELPVAVGYLRVPMSQVTEAAEFMGAAEEPRVGMVWASGEWNRSRSIPIECVERIARGGGAQFWSLQGGVARDDAQTLVQAGLLRDAGECGGGLRVLAAVIANLDLVITVDTLAAHMAGAMGKPVWVLLQHAADWRWMTGRCDSPWYPTIRLFRQSTEGDWGGVIDDVEVELRRLLTGAGASEGAS